MKEPVLPLADARPERFPGPRRRRGTNWGLRNPAGQWLFIDCNIAAFDTAAGALGWIAKPDGFGKDRPMTFRPASDAELAQ